MAETKKITKREMFSNLLEIVKGNKEMEDFINHEIELLNKKKSSNTESKTQIANKGIKETIVNVLGTFTEPIAIKDIQSASEELASLSNQKISALLTQLKNENIVERTENKKVAYFALIK